MTRYLRIALPALFAAGCADMPPERVERDRLILAAVQPCKERYAERLYNPEMMSVNQDGIVRYWYRDGPVGASTDIDRCINEATKGLKVGPWAAGRLVAPPGAASIPITLAGKEVLVPVRVNGVPGVLALHTNSGFTYVKTAYAKRAGLELVSASPITRVRFGTGTEIVPVPYARARSLEIGEARIEPLDIGVYDRNTIPAQADGVLGANVLGHFKRVIDRRGARLTLEPLTQP